jgi:hypothetical protein
MLLDPYEAESPLGYYHKGQLYLNTKTEDKEDYNFTIKMKTPEVLGLSVVSFAGGVSSVIPSG